MKITLGLDSTSLTRRYPRLAVLASLFMALGVPMGLLIGALLAGLTESVPEAQVALCRELTKLHEEVLIGSPAEVAAQLLEPRGELTLVISGLPSSARSASSFDADALVAAATRAGLAPRTIVELLRAAGVPRREAYRAVPTADAVTRPRR